MNIFKHIRPIYIAPLVHIALFAVAVLIFFVHPLRFLAQVYVVLEWVDFPVVLSGYLMFASGYFLRNDWLFGAWILIAGTLWCYFWSWLFFKLKSKPAT